MLAQVLFRLKQICLHLKHHPRSAKLRRSSMCIRCRHRLLVALDLMGTMNEKSALDLERFVQQQHRSQQLLKQQQDMQGAEVTDCNFCNPDQVVETSCGVIAAFLHVKPGKLRRALQMSKGFQGLAGAAEYDVQLKEQAMGHYLLIAWSALLANMDASENDRKCSLSAWFAPPQWKPPL